MSLNLNPDFCQDITAFKDFLRLSRSLVDDTITQNLNNLVLPARFDPASTAKSEKKVLRSPIDDTSCNMLLDTMFQNWDARTSTIDFCLGTVQTKSKPKRQLTAEEIRGRRLDPYSGRDEDEEPILKRVCEQEESTERIIRDRTWRVVRGRCEGLTTMQQDWQHAFAAWKTENGKTI